MRCHQHPVSRAAALGLALSFLGPAWSAPELLGSADLLKDPKFKGAYASALGPRVKDRWLASLSNSAPVRSIDVLGQRYQTATPCKPHDCADYNLMLLYGASEGRVVGKLYEKGRISWIGTPDKAMQAELEMLWKKEFRQQ
ncbi:MAG: Ivy family c-type lysozyme inhibitor [Burkholderiaceae bacterium]|jgi:hypothetical protein|nr:Ivy family c-type lysozyme inhibitor [Burkholderiaceae bacterium]